jgi:hypothetical protein
MQSRHNHLLLSLLSFEKRGKTFVNFLDTNLIQVALECHDTGGLVCLYHGTFGRSAYFQKR